METVRYIYAGWSVDAYVKATEDERKRYDEKWDEIVKTNQEVRAEIARRYTSMMTSAKLIFGEKSNVVRYLDKQFKDLPRWREDYLETCKRAVVTARDQKIKEEVEREQKRKLDEQHQNRLRVLIKMQIKYGLNDGVDAYTILEHFLNQSRYLYLADAMLAARNDFSENSSAIHAAYEFRKRSDGAALDQAIADDVIDAGDDADDGRVFRDCDWNYDRLFELVDTELLEDYRAIRAIVGW